MENINRHNGKARNIIINTLVFVTVISGLAWIGARFIHIGVEYTDNAQVRQNITPLNARIQGFVKEIRFEEFQPVKRGDTLVIIEDTEYRLRALQAEASLQNARQNSIATETSASAARNNIGVSDASIEEVKVVMENAKTDYERYKRLLDKNAVTLQQYEGVKTRYDAALAKYNTMMQQRKSTSLISDEVALRLEQQNTLVEIAETALELARLNLSYTVITAPADGVMGRKNIQNGQLIQPGQTVANIVESGEKWIIANYKETQTANIKPGYEVEIEVDAVSDVKFKGVVRAISDATGASFSLVPTDNSAGNFVKVEQRIPVRIDFTDVNSAEDVARLRSGMNAECKIIF